MRRPVLERLQALLPPGEWVERWELLSKLYFPPRDKEQRRYLIDRFNAFLSGARRRGLVVEVHVAQKGRKEADCWYVIPRS